MVSEQRLASLGQRRLHRQKLLRGHHGDGAGFEVLGAAGDEHVSTASLRRDELESVFKVSHAVSDGFVGINLGGFGDLSLLEKVGNDFSSLNPGSQSRACDLVRVRESMPRDPPLMNTRSAKFYAPRTDRAAFLIEDCVEYYVGVDEDSHGDTLIDFIREELIRGHTQNVLLDVVIESGISVEFLLGGHGECALPFIDKTPCSLPTLGHWRRRFSLRCLGLHRHMHLPAFEIATKRRAVAQRDVGYASDGKLKGDRAHNVCILNSSLKTRNV